MSGLIPLAVSPQSKYVLSALESSIASLMSNKSGQALIVSANVAIRVIDDVRIRLSLQTKATEDANWVEIAAVNVGYNEAASDNQTHIIPLQGIRKGTLNNVQRRVVLFQLWPDFAADGATQRVGICTVPNYLSYNVLSND